MFIGYQNNRACYMSETREELEKLPCVTLDKIEEVEFAELFNGAIYLDKEELLQVKTKEIEAIRRELYIAEVDPITAHINRLRDEELTQDVATEISRLVEERKQKVAEIKANNPYPVEEKPSEVLELYSMEV